MTETRSHEILTCRSRIPAVHAESSRDAQGHAVQRLSSGNIVPARAIDVAQTARSCIAKACGIRSEHLRVSVQTTNAASPFEGRVYGGAVLLIEAGALSANPSALTAALACAAEFAALLANTPTPSRTPSSSAAINAWVSSRSALTMDDLAGTVLLGAKLPVALDIIVPGYQPFQLGSRLGRARPSAPLTEVCTVQGRLRGIMVGGRGQRLFVRGLDTATNVSFGGHAVSFSEQWRRAVTDALATPGQRVLLSIAEERFDDGTSKPRVKRVLTGITLLQPRSTDADRPELCHLAAARAA